MAVRTCGRTIQAVELRLTVSYLQSPAGAFRMMGQQTLISPLTFCGIQQNKSHPSRGLVPKRKLPQDHGMAVLGAVSGNQTGVIRLEPAIALCNLAQPMQMMVTVDSGNLALLMMTVMATVGPGSLVVTIAGPGRVVLTMMVMVIAGLDKVVLVMMMVVAGPGSGVLVMLRAIAGPGSQVLLTQVAHAHVREVAMSPIREAACLLRKL